MLDTILGVGNFQNEVVWQRTNAHNDSRRYGANHDVLLFYTKGAHWTFKPEYWPHTGEYVRDFYRHVEPETGRRYRLSDLTASKPGGDVSYEWTGPSGISVRPYKGRYWAYSRANMGKFQRQGRLVYTRTGMPQYKRYLDEMPGTPLQTVWTDIPPVGSGSKERLGYPTQKPVALLERILKVSSNEGDVVLDAFCGCGTTLEAAAKLGRRWVGVDSSPTACRVMGERLTRRLGLREGRDYQVVDMPKTAQDLCRMPPPEFENWAVLALNGVPNRVKHNDFGIDGRVYMAERVKKRATGADVGARQGRLFDETWYPIQVKQSDSVGREVVDSFVGAMYRDRRTKGYVVGFGFTEGARREMRRLEREQGLEIVPITVDELIEFERKVA